jgi:hypothetical protein
MTDWRQREHASTGARWVTVPPFELDRASGDQVRVVDALPDGLVSAYPQKSREWRDRELRLETRSVDWEREPDLEREDIEPDLDWDL